VPAASARLSTEAELVLDVAEPLVDEYEVEGPLADGLIGDVQIAASCIACLGGHAQSLVLGPKPDNPAKANVADSDLR
jgi:hypothetical protein